MGLWSFDGLHPASGFHPLNGFFLRFFFTFVEKSDWRTIWAIHSLLGILCLTVAACLFLRTLELNFGKVATVGSSFVLLNGALFAFSTSLMESWMVVSVALVIFTLATRGSSDASRMGLIGLIFLGILGSLARQDFGIMIFAFWLAVSAYEGLSSSKSKPWLYALGGCFIGLGMGAFINYRVGGSLTSSSQRVKLHWSALSGHSPIPIVKAIVRPFRSVSDLRSLIFILLVGFILLLVIAIGVYRSNYRAKLEAPLISGALTASIAYIFFYTFNAAAIQNWYFAVFVMPLAVLLAGLTSMATGFLVQPNLFQKFRQLPAAVGVAWVVAVLVIASSSSFRPIWPHQSAMLNASRVINSRSEFAGQNIGSWNAGIIGFFSNSVVINLDGLVNDSAVPFIVRGKLAQYLEEEEIWYLVDFQAMFTDPSRQLRGGYDDQLLRCSSSLNLISPLPEATFRGTGIEIRSITPNCL